MVIIINNNSEQYSHWLKLLGLLQTDRAQYTLPGGHFAKQGEEE